jgi:hypothetical protein
MLRIGVTKVIKAALKEDAEGRVKGEGVQQKNDAEL